jgi:uncharacterized protein with beta-barrel porin domain
MKFTIVKYRLVKFGRHLVSGSVGALAGGALLMVTAANADTTTILLSGGSSVPAVQDMGSTLAGASGGNDGNAGTHDTYNGQYWSLVDFVVQTPSIDALGIGNINNAGDVTNGSATWNYTTVNDNSITLYSGNNITGRTLANGAYVSLYTQNNGYTTGDETSYNYSSFGSSSVLNVQGNNVINGQVGYNFTSWGGTSGQNDMLGAINLNGYDVRFGDGVLAENTYVNSGTNNTSNNDYSFYGTLYSNLNFTQAASVLLNGGLRSLTDSLNSQSTSGNLNYNGYNSIVTLGANQQIDGNISTSGVNGTLIFQGAGTVVGDVSTSASTSLKEMRLNGVGTVALQSNSASEVDYVNYQAAALVAATGGLNMSVDPSSTAKNQVAFNQHDGVLQIGSGASLIGIVGRDVVTTTGNGTLGTVTMVGGNQTITGNVGASGASIKTLNIGGVNSGGIDLTGNSTTTVTGDVYATSTILRSNNATDSRLNMASGTYTLASNLTTTADNLGILDMQGGAQTVTGTVGQSGVDLKAVYAAYDSATTNFTNTNAIYANDFFVAGNGTTTLSGGLVGNLNYSDTLENGTANIAANKGITGNIVVVGNDKGVLTMQGGTQTVAGTVGAASHSLHEVNAGADSATTNFTNTAAVYATTINVTGTGTANLDGGLVGSLAYTNGVSGENGTANFASARSLTGNVTTIANNTGVLNMLGGAQTVSGSVGATNLALNAINAGADGATTTFSDMVYATTLRFTNDDGLTSTAINTADIGDGTVVLNGTNGATGGLVGTVDFQAGTGTLQIGDNVNLTTGSSGIQFANANTGTMTFNGSSTVTGIVGGNTAGVSTLNAINAGVASKTVTFVNTVNVGAGNLNVSGTGTVNLQAGLTGNLDYDAGGTVNVWDGASISGTTTNSNVTTRGTINYLGSTTLSNDIGSATNKLLAVNFHGTTNAGSLLSPVSNGLETQTIDKNIYANTTTIGNTTQATIADVTATGKFLGDNLVLAAGSTAATSVTTLNTAGSVTVANGTVDFAHTKNADGRLTNTATITDSTTGTGAITTNGGTLNFVVGSAAYNALATNGGTDTATSSSITGDTASTLVMNDNEKVNISLLGSLRNGASQTLINVASGSTGSQTATVTDNSYTIDTVLSRVGGDLVVTASRDANTYVTKSDTDGHFSNNAAIRLATLGAAGTNYTADMQTVLNKLDIDQHGYGNNEANLAKEVKRLAPVVNNSLSQSAFGASALPTTTIGNRMANLRGDLVMSAADGAGTGLSAGNDTLKNGVWVKLMGGVGDQDARKGYDGYKTNTWGLIVGADKKVSDKALLGVAISGAMTNIDQQDFRAGDKTKMNNYQVSAYGSYDITDRLYIDGSIAVGKVDYDSDRKTAIGRTASANYSGSYESVNLGAGYRINMGDKKVLTPMIAANYTALHNDAYTEKGADALNLSVDKQNLDRTRAGLGLRFTNQLETAGGTIYRPEVTAMFSHDFGSVVQNTTASYVGDTSGTTFVTPNNNAERDAITVGAGVTVLTGKNSSVQVRYDVEKRDSYLGQGGAVQARWEF